MSERDPQEALREQQIRLMRQDADRNDGWGWGSSSLESIARELRYAVAQVGGNTARPIWPAGGEPGPGMQF